VLGDYRLLLPGHGALGFSQMKTLHAMGSGAGLACGSASLRLRPEPARDGGLWDSTF